ncbi:MAG: shikimate dehydrogenase [Chloroflexota bacterium]
MSQQVSGKTRICGLIGDPVEHTMSPLIQNAAFRESGLDYIYLAFHVKGDELSQAIAGMRALDIAGLNVTIPHKVAVMKYLDKLDPLARMIGSVNTIVNEDGILTGYNTDAPGFLRPLQDGGIEPKGKRVVIMGAGGAARAIAFILAGQDAVLTMLNRTPEKARVIGDRIKETLGKEMSVLELNPGNLRDATHRADILVNTTSIGMSPDTGKTLVGRELLRPGLVVYDIVYNPIETRLLREAREAGARTLDGAHMLAWQGALAFEKWTHRTAPIDLMIKKVTGVLEGHEN